ncbi:FHA domain-containing protein [Arthrobacter sp. 18067]|uniref:FHA domain-containing protein n=1 Tax=Arthrobacter sp. 18067 TaxID=2681413 RepID=UPI00135C14A5|nr:FHA domain-containing protein [Arthrobacter sp. 18067]
MASSNRLSPVRYLQGEWFGVVRNGTVVLLGPDTPHALIDAVWELLASAPEAHEVLHEVTEAFGVSLSRIPPFGIIDSKDALRVFLRGDLELLVQLASGPEQLTGRDVTTWTERRLAGVTSYSLRIGGSSAPEAPVGTVPLSSLPLTEGVVLLSVLDVAPMGLGSDAVPAVPVTAAIVPEQEPAPAQEPAPEQEPAPAQDPAPDQEVQHAASDRVSDETMIGYTEADLGLTIAPGHLGLAAELPAVDEPADDAAADESAAEEDLSSGELSFAEEPSSADEVAPVDPASQGEPDTERVPVQEPEAQEDSEESGAPVHTSTTDPMVPALENTTNYDHLWDKTVMRNIEDAAVRVEDESDDHDAPVSKAPGAPAPAAPALETPIQEPPVHKSPASEPAVQTPAAVHGSGLIESVPWLRSGAAAPVAASLQPAVPSGHVAGPAPQMPSGWPPAPPQTPSVDEDSDHDGQTIMKSSLPSSDEESAKAATASAQSPAPNGPSVLARVCSQGHANPPTYPQCSVCGTALAGDAEQVPRPRLGRMRLSTGELIDLDQSLIIGRQPSVSRVQGGTMPKLVQVESPGGDISRSHVEVRLEGWHVMLCDLKATNGTVLIREGQAPRRLAQNEMAILLDGDIAELGDDISLRFEEIL